MEREVAYQIRMPEPAISVQVRLVAPNATAIAAAIVTLQARHGRNIRFRPPRPGRKGGFIAYGTLTM